MDAYRREQDVAYQSVPQLCDQREHHAARGTESVYEIGLLRSSKGFLVHIPDRAPVVRPLIADDDLRNGSDRSFGDLSVHAAPSSP